jgi:hypothetical protein
MRGIQYNIKWRILAPAHDSFDASVSVNHQREGEFIPKGIEALGAFLDPVANISEDRLDSANYDPSSSLVRHLHAHQEAH